MVEYNVHRISPQYDFTINGVSYIGKPIPHTAMFITQKAKELLKNLNNISDCLIFAEKGLVVEEHIRNCNCFVFSDNPQWDYARFTNELYREWKAKENRRKFRHTQGGYILGENVQIGNNAYIEPGCLIGHDVIIGDNAYVLAGAVIKRSVIGKNVLVNEKAVVGAYGFTMAEDGNGNKFRIPTLGKVRIGNYVEIGVHDNISCGSGGDTIIEDYVKLDALVHIGHDAYLGKNVEITAGSIVGGFAWLDDKAYVGINATIRNRVTLKENSFIGMGAVVTSSVDSNVIVAGNPAKLFEKQNKRK